MAMHIFWATLLLSWCCVANRDLANPPLCNTLLYSSIGELGQKHHALVAGADMVIMGSYVPERVERTFYNGQRFAMNITRADMIAAGYSPSVRLFEAAAHRAKELEQYFKAAMQLGTTSNSRIAV